MEFETALWVEQQALTIEHLIARIGALAPVAVLSGTSGFGETDPTAVDGEDSASRGRRGRVLRRALALGRQIRSRQEYLILERDLGQTVVHPPSRVSVDVRPVRPEDVPGVAELFGPRRGARNVTELGERLAAGYHCLGAWVDGRWAAIDYVTDQRHWHGFLRLTVVPAPGHVYGFGLHEAPRLQGLGVGLTLLAASIELARSQGYRRQFTIVERGNQRMLSASAQIFGFRVVGQLVRGTLAGISRTTGGLGDAPIRGRELIL